MPTRRLKHLARRFGVVLAICLLATLGHAQGGREWAYWIRTSHMLNPGRAVEEAATVSPPAGELATVAQSNHVSAPDPNGAGGWMDEEIVFGIRWVHLVASLSVLLFSTVQRSIGGSSTGV
jgi:hypothetical protein